MNESYQLDQSLPFRLFKMDFNNILLELLIGGYFRPLGELRSKFVKRFDGPFLDLDHVSL